MNDMAQPRPNDTCGSCGKQLASNYGTPVICQECWDRGIVATATAAPPTRETVNHPSHYHAESGIEVIDAIEAWRLGFSLGNSVKYIARAGHKDSPLQDLKKARWYLERAIANVEQGKAP